MMPILYDLIKKTKQNQKQTNPLCCFQANISLCNSNESEQSTPATALTEIYFHIKDWL